MGLPHESNYAKSVSELVHELEINHERVNASGEGARKLCLENEALRKEQRRNWEQYQIAIKERNEFEAELKAIHRNHEGIERLRAELKEAINERDEERARAARSTDHNKRLLEELSPLRRLLESIRGLVSDGLAPDDDLDEEAIEIDEDDEE